MECRNKKYKSKMRMCITEALRSHQVDHRKYMLVSVPGSRDRPKTLVNSEVTRMLGASSVLIFVFDPGS